MRLFELLTKVDKKTLFVRRNLKNSKAIIDWAKEQGFPTCVPADELHVTIAYSKEKVDWNDTTPLKDTVRIKADTRKLEKLGDAIVLRFYCEDLQDRWAEFVDDVECAWDFPSYKQHMSISFFPDNIDFKKMTPYTGELIFGPEEFSEIKKDWKKSFKEIELNVK